MARILPSVPAPMRTFTSISWRGEEAVILSSRVKISREGFLVIQVTKAGNTSATTVCLAPKPPPMRALVTRIRVLGIPKALERILRT